MRFCINKNEAPSRGLLRVAREQVEHALSELEANRNAVEQVHEVRRSLKRLRAAVELAGTSPASQNSPTCELLRVAGRLLAPFRDIHVMGRALADLKRAEKNAIYSRLAAELAREEKLSSRQLRPQLEDSREILSISAGQIERWRIEEFTSADLGCGVHKSYKLARKAFRKASKDPRPELLHQWRIRTKSLWHCLLLIEPLCPKSVHRMEQKACKLGDYLGDDRDLALLCDRLQTRESRTRDLQQLLKAIARKRAKLQKRAFQVGEDIFEAKPGAFRKEIGRRLNNKGS